MRTVAPGVHLLSGFPPYALNVYLVGDVLVDAATWLGPRRIRRQLQGREMTAHVITHAHPDHFGGSAAVCDRLGIELWVGKADHDAVESGTPQLARNALRWPLSIFPTRSHVVDRDLVEGDEVSDFTVVEVPGHTPGSIALWRASDGVLICGDVLFHQFGLTGSPKGLSVDVDRNRQSMEKLAELDPRLVLFGHGRPARFDAEHPLTV
ncbi:MBL fold metallo-hydrolase [Agromyces sp. NPDC004153]